MLPDLPGGLTSYAVFAALALLTAVMYNYFKLDEIGITFGQYALYCIIGAVGAVLFAKLLFAISYLPTVGFSLYNLLYYSLYGGIVFYGGLFGLVLGIIIVSYFLHKDQRFILDSFSISFPLFHSIARWGCFFGGCCYGIPWSWGFAMSESPDVIRFPVQIAESICCFSIFIFLSVRAKQKNSRSRAFRAYLFSYACCRFFLEYLRADTDRGIWFSGLSTSQIISMLILVAIALQKIIRMCIAQPRSVT